MKFAYNLQIQYAVINAFPMHCRKELNSMSNALFIETSEIDAAPAKFGRSSVSPFIIVFIVSKLLTYIPNTNYIFDAI